MTFTHAGWYLQCTSVYSIFFIISRTALEYLWWNLLAVHICPNNLFFLHCHFLCLFVTFQRVTALSSDNGRQLACHAMNSALLKPVETTMTLNVYCECLNLSLNWRSTPSLCKEKKKKKHTLYRAGTEPEGGPWVSGLVHSVCVSGARKNIRAEGKVTPTSKQHSAGATSRASNSQGSPRWTEVHMRLRLITKLRWNRRWFKFLD